MTTPNLVDPFHRALYAVLVKELENRMGQLAEGSACTNTNDTQTVAEKYAAQVSYIKALHDILEKCEELEADLFGTKQKRKDE